MKNERLLFIVFFIGILGSALCFSYKVLDTTLTPRFIILAIALSTCALLVYKFNTEKKISINLILLTYLSYVGFSCLSTLWSHTSSEAIFENAKLILGLGVFCLTVYFFKKFGTSFEQWRLKLFFIPIAIVLSIGIYQLQKLTKIDKETLYTITGFNGHKNLFSSFIFLNLFFLLNAFVLLNKWWKALSSLLIISCIIILIILKTKAVFVGLAITLVFFGLLLLYKRLPIKRSIGLPFIIIPLLIISGVFFGILLPQVITKTVKKEQAITPLGKTELDQERLMLWDKTYTIINKQPIVGVGSGNWQVYFPDAGLTGLYRAEDLNFTFQRPHNDFLWVLSETGWIGFMLFLSFIFLIVVLTSNTLKHPSISHQSIITTSLCISFVLGYFSISFFDFPKERIEHSVWLNILLASCYFQVMSLNPPKILFSIPVKGFTFFAVFVVFISIIGVGIKRFQGEYYTRKLYDAKNGGITSEVIKQGEKAKSFVYSMDPTSIPIDWYMGNAYALMNDYDNAFKFLSNAYVVNPYNRNVLNDLASAYVMKADKEKAKQLYKEALRISPRFDDPKLNLIALLIQDTHFLAADSCLNTLLHDSPRRTEYQQLVNSVLNHK
jgi:O-antigen ligase